MHMRLTHTHTRVTVLGAAVFSVSYIINGAVSYMSLSSASFFSVLSINPVQIESHMAYLAYMLSG